MNKFARGQRVTDGVLTGVVAGRCVYNANPNLYTVILDNQTGTIGWFWNIYAERVRNREDLEPYCLNKYVYNFNGNQLQLIQRYTKLGNEV